MPKASYHPVCVLYQGNDSPYDGTYQLICRHQIKDQDFSPGDVVEVLPDPHQTDEPSGPHREAIALGDEMIVGLLGNFCSSFSKPKRTRAQTAGCTSSNSNEGPPCKKVKVDAADRASMKVETPSTSNQKELPQGEGAAEEMTNQIFRGMSTVRAQNQAILHEIKIMKQQQVQFQQELILIKEALKTMKNGQSPPVPKPAPPPHQMDYLEMEDVPSQVGLRPAIIPSPIDAADVSESPAMSEGSKDECSQYPTSPITMNPPADQADSPYNDGIKDESFEGSELASIGSFQYQAYPHYMDVNKQYDYQFADENNTMVYIGSPEFDRKLPKVVLDQLIMKTSSPASYSYRLGSKLFTTEEMLKGNTSGIGVAKTGIHFTKLDNTTLTAILTEIENRFPGARTTHEGDRRLLSAINDCCRNRRKRTLYNKMKIVPDTPGQSGVIHSQRKGTTKEQPPQE